MYRAQPYRLLHVGQRTVDATADVIAQGLTRATGGDPPAPAAADQAGAGEQSQRTVIADTAAADSSEPPSVIRSKWRATQRSWGRIGAGDVVSYDDTVSLAYACGTTPIHACLFTSVLAKVLTYVVWMHTGVGGTGR